MVRIISKADAAPAGKKDQKSSSIVDETDLGIYDDVGEGEDLTDNEEEKNKNLVLDNEQKYENFSEPMNSDQKQLHKVSIATVLDTTNAEDSGKNYGHKRYNDVIQVSISGRLAKSPPVLKAGRPLKSEGTSNKPLSSGKHVQMVANENVDGMTVDNITEDRISVSTTCEVNSYSGLRGKTCTPASMADTDWSELRDLQVLESRIGVGSRQGSRPLFSRASDQASVVKGGSGFSTPQYFYISQQKPAPMPPLKAWRGFNGNVYFEPLHISKTFQTNIPRKKTPQPNESSNPAVDRKNYNCNLAYRQFSVLDRKSIMNRENSRLPEDLQWIDGLEAPGSLRTEPIKKKKVNVSDRRQICRGSVVRNVSKGDDGKALLSVSGDRFSKNQQFGPPLMRTQTQYSLSNQRLTTNSPDLIFPPLDQTKMSLRHVEQETGKETILHIIPPGDRFKYQTTSTHFNLHRPVHKYSPEIPSTARSSMMGN